MKTLLLTLGMIFIFNGCAQKSQCYCPTVRFKTVSTKPLPKRTKISSPKKADSDGYVLVDTQELKDAAKTCAIVRERAEYYRKVIGYYEKQMRLYNEKFSKR